MYQTITTELQLYVNSKKIPVLQRFFKTGKGQYGEGDKFLGITVPYQRIVAEKYTNTDFATIQKLLESQYHEHRLTALLILVYKYKAATRTKNAKGCKEIYTFYLKNLRYINNWDLVDITCPNIVGHYLLDKTMQRARLYTLSKSKNLWKRRVAILATFTFIRNNQYDDTLAIAKILLDDSHDLIHKAVGWMLREIGKRDIKIETHFLNRYASQMPRTMLRYAIEKFPPKKRVYYLTK